MKNQKTSKIIYYASTGLLTALMLFSAGMEIFAYDELSKAVENLGYPTYIIYPLATAKLLGLFAIWSRISITLKEWAYAGFFFDVILGASAHLTAGDGEAGGAILGIILVLVSVWSERKVFGNLKQSVLQA